jgi:hypothetical protein
VAWLHTVATHAREEYLWDASAPFTPRPVAGLDAAAAAASSPAAEGDTWFAAPLPPASPHGAALHARQRELLRQVRAHLLFLARLQTALAAHAVAAPAAAAVNASA